MYSPVFAARASFVLVLGRAVLVLCRIVLVPSRVASCSTRVVPCSTRVVSCCLVLLVVQFFRLDQQIRS